MLWLGAGTTLSVRGEDSGEAVQALPPPRTAGGRPLLDALRTRSTGREFSARPVGEAVLSDLLWAAFGVNREATGQRTAPSAMNAQEVDLYLATPEGVWRYLASQHALARVSGEDVRRWTGGQDYVTTAPLTLVYVADLRRLAKAPAEDREFYAAIDTGFIGQNVYLFCASEGLSSVVHVVGEKTPLAHALRLDPEQRIILAHTVGYPSESSPAEASP